MDTLKSTLLHVLELVIIYAVVLGIALLVKKLFAIDMKPTVEVATGLVLAGVMKFLRASPDVPVKDYVNE